MRYERFAAPLVAMVATLGLGCADSDNPVALAELQPTSDFTVSASRVETFEEVEVRVRVRDGGEMMMMRNAELEIEPAEGGSARVIGMEADADGYVAHVTFFEPGIHHLHLTGTPEGHMLSTEMGEHEIEVHRRHALVGPYWVELEVSPAPIQENSSAHIHLHAYDASGGSKGEPAEGLEIELEVHDPFGAEFVVPVTEEEGGEYEAEYLFGDAGLYELHVGIAVGGDEVSGEFHLPVLGEESAPVEGGDNHGGGHGH